MTNIQIRRPVPSMPVKFGLKKTKLNDCNHETKLFKYIAGVAETDEAEEITSSMPSDQEHLGNLLAEMQSIISSRPEIKLTTGESMLSVLTEVVALKDIMQHFMEASGFDASEYQIQAPNMQGADRLGVNGVGKNHWNLEGVRKAVSLWSYEFQRRGKRVKELEQKVAELTEHNNTLANNGIELNKQFSEVKAELNKYQLKETNPTRYALLHGWEERRAQESKAKASHFLVRSGKNYLARIDGVYKFQPDQRKAIPMTKEAIAALRKRISKPGKMRPQLLFNLIQSTLEPV